MPILANVLIKTGTDSVDIFATDLEVGIKETVPAEVRDEGTVTVSAKKLFEIVKEVPTETLSLRKKRITGLRYRPENLSSIWWG
jgi:DNA polymerase-3 subunit beta